MPTGILWVLDTTDPTAPAPVAPPGSSPIPGTIQPPPGAAAAAQVLAAPPAGELRVAAGPYPVPISIAGAARLSTVSVAMTFNPQALRVRTIQEGSFMRQGGVNATFVQQVDGSTGRIDITISRTGDAVGASGTGLLGVVLFDAIAPGPSTFMLSGVATTPEGTPVPLMFGPASVVVR